MSTKKSLRTIKIILPSLIAVAMLFVVAMSSAFQTGTQANANIDEPILWELSHPNNDVTIPASYVPYVGENPECEGTNQICVIEAPSDGEPTPRPVISAVTNLMEDLAAFQQEGDAQNMSGAVRYKP